MCSTINIGSQSRSLASLWVMVVCYCCYLCCVYGQPVLCVSVIWLTPIWFKLSGVRDIASMWVSLQTSLFFYPSQLPPFFSLQWSIDVMHIWPHNLSFTGDCLQAQGCLVHKKNGFKKVICYPFIVVMS